MPGSGRAPRSSLETNYDIIESLASLDKKIIVCLETYYQYITTVTSY